MKKIIAFIAAALLVSSAHAFNETVEVSWNDPGSEDGFVLERSGKACALSAAGDWTQIAAPGANVLSYTDTVQDNATYCYRIKAVKDGLFGPYFKTADVIVPKSLADIVINAVHQP